MDQNGKIHSIRTFNKFTEVLNFAGSVGKRIKLEEPQVMYHLPELQPQIASSSRVPQYPVISQCYSFSSQHSLESDTKPESSDDSSDSTDKQLEELSLKFYKEKLKSKEKKWKKFKREKESLENENQRLSLEVNALKEENHRLLLENYTLRHQTITRTEVNRSSETLEFVLQVTFFTV